MELLIVEDDQNLRCLLRVLMAGTQFEVTTAETMKEVRRVIEEDFANFDIVLCDSTLADSDLTETIPGVRRLIPGVPVVAVTGWADEATKRLLKRQGAADVLLKGDSDWVCGLVSVLEKIVGLEVSTPG